MGKKVDLGFPAVVEGEFFGGGADFDDPFEFFGEVGGFHIG